MNENELSKLYLASPSLSLKKPYIEMLTEWRKTGEHIIPWVLRLDYSDFYKLTENLNAMREGKGCYVKKGQPEYLSTEDAQHLPAPGGLASATFWFMRTDGKMLGASNIRFELNNELIDSGGHIGYGIRPSQRNQGYATVLLHLSLLELKKNNVEKVRVTCASDNIASERVILKNGGVFDSEVLYDGVLTKRYWIDNS